MATSIQEQFFKEQLKYKLLTSYISNELPRQKFENTLSFFKFSSENEEMKKIKAFNIILWHIFVKSVKEQLYNSAFISMKTWITWSLVSKNKVPIHVFLWLLKE